MTIGALIALDWGTSSFRAYLLDRRGTIIDQRSAPMGIMQVPPDGFEAVLEQEAGPWFERSPDLPVIASGMVGSRQGWVEVPYLPCPCDVAEVARALQLHRTQRGRQIRFIPGLVTRGEVPDVIRGEETEIVGAAPDFPDARLFLLPGTHSKWVEMEGSRIRGFATFMTGEVYAVLRSHSILGRLIEGEAGDEAAFAEGAARGLASGDGQGGLLHKLFSARTLPLTRRLPAAGVASYLSGLLIGAEIAEARGMLGLRPGGPPVVLVGGADLVGRYVKVLAMEGSGAVRAAPHAAARGMFRIAQAAGMLD